MTLVERKSGVFTAEFKATKNAQGNYDLTLSVPTEDRDGEIIDAKAFEPLPEWIPIDVDHGMTVVTTVGSGDPAYEGEALKLNNFSFASTPFAKDVKTLVDERHIRKMSVAFMDSVREVDESDGKVHIRKAELLNAAIVAIPSNREADIAFAKSLEAQSGQRHVAVHALKAVAGSYEDRADRLRQALRSENPAAQWLWIRATFDDSVVFEVEDQLGNIATYRADYQVDGDTFTFGDPTEVDLAEVIVPPVKSISTPADPEDKTPATAAQAAVSAVDPPADVAVARARIAHATAALLTP